MSSSSPGYIINPSAKKRSEMDKKAILIIDDDQDFRYSLRMIL